MKSKSELKEIFTRNDWNEDTLRYADDVINKINDDTLKLSIYPNQYEIVTAEQMLDAYSLIGLPTSYNHWKFGKSFAINQNKYKRGQMGLSYEMVINSNPCISYNMEENTTCLMLLVMAHAGIGHNAFFKNNYLFKQWTQADAIIDYMVFAKKFVSKCEEKYGYEEVESVLDACHALMQYGVSKYKKPYKMDVVEEFGRVENHESLESDIWRTVPKKIKDLKEVERERFPKNPEENILYFIEKNSPILEDWQRELVRIVRKTSQYFYPQAQTKVANEGCATFTHYHLIEEMHKQGYVDDGFMLEFYHHHSNVIFQPGFDSPYYSGMNPYTLGFNILMDVKRMCQNPTSEDKEWFPNVVGTDWVKTFHHIVENYKDDSFIAQYLSPNLMREMRMFGIEDIHGSKNYTVNAIHNDSGYLDIRDNLSNFYNRSRYVPDIQVYDVDLYGDRTLTLKYTSYDSRELKLKSAEKVLEHLAFLWGFPIRIVDDNKKEIYNTKDDE
jgi:stage V sporulation protein R